ncbi:MAG: hypothetical protein HQK89_17330 [Nitrospirae bacterium]|nr:hypothetical protein [Nitrospirota bacterium]
MHVISFFSFKGSVGRTYLMVNAAYALAKEGAFVVVADWDLHAPGLTVMERMHRPEPESDEENKARRNPDVRKGVLDYIQGALHPYDDDGVPDPMTMAKPTRLGQNARKRDEEGHDSFKGDIWFIPAGRFNPTGLNKEYHDQLLNVMGHDLSDWIMEPDKSSSEPQLLVEFFCERVIEVKHPDMDNRPPDFLLIDSRTGLTEIGNLLLKAESVNRMVLVSGFNDQNLTGLEAVIRDIQTVVGYNELSSRLSIVLSPVPQGEERLKTERVKKFEELLGSLAREEHGVKEFMPDAYYVPYHPHVALNEDLMVESYPETDLAKAVFDIVGDIKRKSN